jgi:cell division protein FtsQ
VEAKFNRLLLFYKQIMNKTGWNYYSNLDVRYDKQLVAVRRDSASLFKSFALATKDSIRISNVIDSLQIAKDTSLAIIKKDSIVGITSKTKTQNPAPVPVKTQSNPSTMPVKNQNPTPVKAKSKTDEENVLNEVKKQNAPKPKAVMEKKNQQKP